MTTDTQEKPAKAPAKKLTAVEAMIAEIPDTGEITVGCKLPNGMILRLFDMVSREEVTLTGSRTVVQAMLKPDLEPVHIRGCSAPMGSPIVLFGGYALTHNVDAQFFREWLRQNADSDIVKNRLIFAHEKADHLQDKAAESVAVMSGMQPLNPEGDYRSPRSAKTGVSKIETAKLSEAA